MERRSFNVLKQQILQCLESGEEQTSDVIALVLRANLTNVCDCLLRLFRLRLVDRHAIETGIPGRPRYAYKISSRGLARLLYWQQKEGS